MYTLTALVYDLAGQPGHASTSQVMNVTANNTWTYASSGANASPVSNLSNTGDWEVELGDVTWSHAPWIWIRVPARSQSGDPALVYNS